MQRSSDQALRAARDYRRGNTATPATGFVWATRNGPPPDPIADLVKKKEAADAVGEHALRNWKTKSSCVYPPHGLVASRRHPTVGQREPPPRHEIEMETPKLTRQMMKIIMDFGSGTHHFKPGYLSSHLEVDHVRVLTMRPVVPGLLTNCDVTNSLNLAANLEGDS